MRFTSMAVLLLLTAGCLDTSLLISSKESTQALDLATAPGDVLPQADLSADVLQSSDSPQSDILPASDVMESSLADDPSEESSDSEDVETLEDNALLSAGDQTLPEDEGLSQPVEEVTFDFPVVENAKVQHFIDYYTGRGRKTFTRWLERSTRYIPLIQQIFEEEGLPRDLAYLAMVESGFNPRAYSWAHAVGPWQFIESTGRLYGLKNDWWHDERRDYEKSTRAAAKFLKDLYERFDGDWYLAVASYNAGPGKISRAIKKYKTRDFWEISRGKYLQAETKNYVPKLLASLLIAKEPEKYGFSELAAQEPLDYETVEIPTATDLEIVADLCGVSYDDIKGLNPELKRWCTPPDKKSYTLKIPAGVRDSFMMGYSDIPQKDRANYLRHKVRKGDTILALANRYGIRVDDILKLNNIGNPRALRIGINLVLPLKKGYNPRPIAELSDDYVRTKRQVYTVKTGDSLWKIARRFGVTEKELRVWNRLGWSNVIRPGQRLVVSSAAAKGSKSKKVAKVRSDGPLEKVTYRVKPGDTLWEISRRYDVDTKQIMHWNGFAENHVIRPGDTLTLHLPGRHSG